MVKIISKEKIAPKIYEIKVKAPRVAVSALPGQFVVLRLFKKGERFPLTVVDTEKNTGEVTLVVQAVGKSTRQLVSFSEGDQILDFLGPLGEPAEIDNFGRVGCLAGGVGAALIFPVARTLYEKGNEVVIFLGARSADYLILEERLKRVSSELIITTDDGSRGIKGFGTEVLAENLKGEEHFNRVFAAGPIPMMKAVSEVTRPYEIKTTVSLNPIMVDGTGMCGGCRVTVDGQTKFACMDGPEFNGHRVDFDELINRRQFYDQHDKCRLEEL